MTKTARSIVDDLVQRRLWPVALLLVAAIVAVPLLMTKSSAHPSTAPAAASGATGATADIAVADDTTTDDTPASGRALARLGKDDPFVQRGKQVKTDTGGGSPDNGATATASGGSGVPAGSSGASASAGSSGSSDTSSAGGGSAASSAASSTPSASTTPAAHPAPAKHASKAKPKADTGPAVSLDLAFGRVNGGPLTRHHELPRFAALPRSGDPVAIFLGVDGRDTAVFMVPSNVTPIGDGSCKPKPSNCQTVRLRPGETEFFEVTPGSGSPYQYQLDLKQVHVRRTETKASAASAGARAKEEAAIRPPRRASWGKLLERLKLSDDAGFADIAGGLNSAGAQVGTTAAP